MRVSTSQFQIESVARMLEQQQKLGELQQKISTGRRILTPSEDPAGSARILDLNQVIEVNEQYQRNAGMIRSRLQTEDITLGSFHDVYQRIRELAVQGLNEPLGQQNRTAIAAEMRLQLSELIALASRQDSNGDYLFSGFQVDQAPVNDNGTGTYTYGGDQGQRRVAVGNSVSIEDSDNGFDLFFNVANTSENAFSAVYNFATSLENNTQAASSLNDLDEIMNNILTYRSRIGSRLNALDIQDKINENAVLQSKQLLSDVEDLDLAEAITQLNLQRTGLEAAQQSYVRVQGLSLFNFL